MNDHSSRLRSQAHWLETRNFASLSGHIERAAADEIDRLESVVAPLLNAAKKANRFLARLAELGSVASIDEWCDAQQSLATAIKFSDPTYFTRGR